MNEELKKLNEEVAELKNRLDALNSNTTIPLDVGKAITERVASEQSVVPAIATQTTKAASSETISINESGASLHTVLDNPDGFLKVVISSNGIPTTYYLPYFL